MLKFDVASLVDLQSFLEATPQTANKAMSLAMNDVLSHGGLTRLRKAVAAEVNFPAGYAEDRISFDQRATPTRLVASVLGRQRPTSLARFATSGAVGGKGGVTVRVKKANKTFMNGFLVRLRQGGAITDDGYNVGLAVRLKPGQVLNKRDQSSMVHLDTNVVLLFGPSVDQILRNEAADAEGPNIAQDIADEFFRNFQRLS